VAGRLTTMLLLTSKHAPPTMSTTTTTKFTPSQVWRLCGLLTYCRQQAKIERCNYDANSHWRADIRTRNQALKLCRTEFGARLNVGTEELVPGNYGRLTIHPDGTPEYAVGQYAPAEIYDYLHWYLRQTNAV
jgi:hypothetical protein